MPPPKWNAESEAKALIALIHVLHKGAPKLDRDTCKQLKADMSEEGFSEEAIRQRIQGMLRKYAADKDSPATAVPSSDSPTKPPATTGSKRKATASKDTNPAKKRAKTVPRKETDSQSEKEETVKVKEEEVEGSENDNEEYEV
ncbi:MAG: hypothetical protein Q9208_005450 [Pyrenodesmia sp. 3 TL-2023]